MRFYCYLWSWLYMHLQLSAHGVKVRPFRDCLSTLGLNSAVAPVLSRAIDFLCHLHEELACLLCMSVHDRSRSPANAYRFCEPSSSTGFEPAQMAPHGGGTQHGVWILFEFFERDSFFGGDLQCTIRSCSEPSVHIMHCSYSLGRLLR